MEARMAVDSLQRTAETAVRGRPFAKGQSGNPTGRPRGSRNRASLAAARLLDGEAETLSRKAVELAMAGDPAALRLCLDRIVAPRRERPVEFALPSIDSAADLGPAMAAITRAAASGSITPGEAALLARTVEIY